MNTYESLVHDLKQQLEELKTELSAGLRDGTGDLSSVDQHPADSGSDLYERERTLGRITDLEERIRLIEQDDRPIGAGSTDPPDDAGDSATPLDEVGDQPEDLAAIPMGPAPSVDSDDDDQEAEIDGPGMVYHDGVTAPDVGEDDDVSEGSYRPS